MLVLPLGCGRGGETDDDRFHPLLVPENAYPGDIPESARPVSFEALTAMLDSGEATLLTPERIASEQQAQAEQDAAHEADAQLLYADVPDVLAFHTTEPTPRADLERLGDGNWRFDYGGNGDPEEQVVLMGQKVVFGDLAMARTRFNAKENQVDIYRRIHARLDPAAITTFKLPSVAEAASLDLANLQALTQGTSLLGAARLSPSALCFAPPERPASRAGEVGADTGGDLRGPGGDPVGLWADVCFPLKWFATSVKSQGRRGSCVSFGITAAVEAQWAFDHREWLNLSEQMLYNRAKQAWWPSNYGDALYTGDVLAQMIVRTFRYPYEGRWDYNPSRSRIDLGSVYKLSCQGYSAPSHPCSDTNHQARLVCFDRYCADEDPTGEVPADAQVRILGFESACDPGVVSLNLSKALLAIGIPVIVCVETATNMRSANVAADGIVELSFPITYSGRHCMCLMGYVANADLPFGYPPGGGGGYFICKNSWGTNYGDNGYVYLSENWVHTYAHALYFITDISRS